MGIYRNMNNQILHQVLEPELLEAQPCEWGLTIHCQNPSKIGFATTLTPTIITQASEKELDLIITHHDTWEFMLEERRDSYQLLAENRISHIWCHEPLDKSDFGTAASLLRVLGCRIIGKIVEDCGRIGELPNEQDLSTILERFDEILSERPCRVVDTGKPINKIACVPGAGNMTHYLAEALDHDVDLYITGETSLYLLEYAVYRKVSLLIYSHNYTEIFGTENLARKIADLLEIKDVIRLEEPHY
jgi:putative NIF3 family GTP cyclohydrolase 1 type 2